MELRLKLSSTQQHFDKVVWLFASYHLHVDLCLLAQLSKDHIFSLALDSPGNCCSEGWTLGLLLM